jgi:putative tryptophan/tyrosine transport system substrate-binding protein
LSFFTQEDPQGKIWDVAFRKRLNALGWVEGRNLEIQLRWAAGDLDRVKVFAKELTALNPELLLGITTPVVAALQHETRTIPILFAAVSDPIGSGFGKSLSNPGGNITGYMFIEASLASKWPDLMRAIAPQVSRVGLLFNPATASYARYYLGDASHRSYRGSRVCLPAPVDHFKETRSTSVLVSPHSRAKRRLLCITGRLSRAPGG